MTGQPADTSHIRSPRDIRTPEEREAVRQQLRQASRSLWAHVAEHGDVRQELRDLYGDPWDILGESDAA